MTQEIWSLKLCNGEQCMSWNDVKIETRPSLDIEEDLRVENGQNVYYPRIDANGKLICQWRPITICNVPRNNDIPSGELTATIQLIEDDKVLEKWILQKVVLIACDCNSITINHDDVKYAYEDISAKVAILP